MVGIAIEALEILLGERSSSICGELEGRAETVATRDVDEILKGGEVAEPRDPALPGEPFGLRHPSLCTHSPSSSGSRSARVPVAVMSRF